MRQAASGRGGEKQFNLTAARVRETLANAQLKELEFHTKAGNLVCIDDLESIYVQWAVQCRNEITGAINKIVMRLQEQHGISIDRESVNEDLQFAYEAIAAYPKLLADNDPNGPAKNPS